jgi:hypothetical protein
MKLRVALCAAVLLPAAAAFAQPHPWPYGPYDKLRLSDTRVPKSFQDSESSRLKRAGIVVVAPAEKKADANARLIGHRLDELSGVNSVKLPPPKSKGQ